MKDQWEFNQHFMLFFLFRRTLSSIFFSLSTVHNTFLENEKDFSFPNTPYPFPSSDFLINVSFGSCVCIPWFELS